VVVLPDLLFYLRLHSLWAAFPLTLSLVAIEL